MNTQISYVYRDSSNYKQCSDIIVAGEASDSQRERLAATLDDGIYFCPLDVSMDPIWPDEYDDDIDHNGQYFHVEDGMVDVDFTDGLPTDPRTVEQFVQDFEQAAQDGWPTMGEDPALFRDVSDETVLAEDLSAQLETEGYDWQLVDAIVGQMADDSRVFTADEADRVRERVVQVAAEQRQDESYDDGDGQVTEYVVTIERTDSNVLQALADQYDMDGICRFDMDRMTVTLHMDEPADAALDLVNDFVADVSRHTRAGDVTVSEPSGPTDRLKDAKVRKRAIRAVVQAEDVGPRKAANLLDRSDAPHVTALRYAYSRGIATPEAVAALNHEVVYLSQQGMWQHGRYSISRYATNVAVRDDGETFVTGLPQVCNDPLTIVRTFDKLY